METNLWWTQGVTAALLLTTLLGAVLIHRAVVQVTPDGEDVVVTRLGRGWIVFWVAGMFVAAGWYAAGAYGWAMQLDRAREAAEVAAREAQRLQREADDAAEAWRWRTEFTRWSSPEHLDAATRALERGDLDAADRHLDELARRGGR